ncbi:MAG: P1 family peptidase [Actinobacteria bacterium]|nr:P1 family peptidase [Actinomycetota bacterium]
MIPKTLIGHFTNQKDATGCTVIIFEGRAICGYHLMGGAPGTRETDLLKPGQLVNNINAIMLSGGSAFGLAAADGAVRFLSEKGIGYNTHITKVPIVPAAIIFDFIIGSRTVYPDSDAGYAACMAASDKFERGCVGAGTGATVGKIRGPFTMMKSGLGYSSIELGFGASIHAIAVANAYGDIIDEGGKIIAGAYNKRSGLMNTAEMILKKTSAISPFLQNTTLITVITDAKLDKSQANFVAQAAHDGMARSISPSHTILDGDLCFAVSVGNKAAKMITISHAAAVVTQHAIIDAVKSAESLHGVLSARDIGTI